MIFVTGCARSGTSLITQILQGHGCHLGADNRINSLYENVGIRQNVLKPYLRSIGADEMGQRLPFPETNTLPPYDALAQHVHKFIYGQEPMAYKDAKLTLVWPVFAQAFPAAKWVIARRDRNAIARSCLRTPFMRASPTEEYWLQWVDEHVRRFEEMKSKLDTIEVWADSIVEDPMVFKPVAVFCGLQFNKDATEKAIDKAKWHRSE